MPSQTNIDQVALLADKIKSAKSVAVVEYSGTTVNDQVKLRAALKAAGGEFLVTKNKLIDIAFGTGKLADSLKGMNALVFSFEDEVGAIKELFKFHSDTEKLTIKQGSMEGKVLSAAEVEALSKVPGRSELMAMLLARLQSPASGLVNVLKASQRDLVQVLRAISEKSTSSQASS